MLELLIVLVRTLALALRGHQELALENVALRHQLTAFPVVTTVLTFACAASPILRAHRPRPARAVQKKTERRATFVSVRLTSS